MSGKRSTFPDHCHRFDRKGRVVQERRPAGPLYGTDHYITGDPIFAARHGSPARRRFHATRQATRNQAFLAAS